MATRDTVTVLAEQFALAFLRLGAFLETAEGQRELLRELGWDFTTPPPALGTLVDPVAAVTAFGDVDEVPDDQIPQLLAAVAGAFAAIAALTDAVVVHYFFEQQPRWGYLLLLLGIITVQEISAAGGRLPYVALTFAYAQLGDLLSAPLTFLKDHYQWGDSGFKGELFAANLLAFLDAWELRVQRGALGGTLLSQLQSGALSPSTASRAPLWLVLLEDRRDPVALNLAIGLYLLPETASAKPGFAILPVASAGLDEQIALSDDITLALSADVNLTSGVGLFVRPDEDVSFTAGLATGAPAPVSGMLALQLKLQPGDPIIIIGSANASRLQIGGMSTTGGVRLDGSGGREVFTEFTTEAGRVVINPAASDSDGFLASLLPAGGVNAPFDLRVGFSTSKGLYFGGAGGFEITIPAHLQVGPVEIQTVTIGVRSSNGAIPIALSAAFSADLSVLKATVDGVGLTANLTFPNDRSGNLGPADLQLEFKPPTGLGLAIDAGSVHGGGFISFDSTAGRYSGALQLSIYDIAVNAFGLIETKVPGVSYSFVIIISAEFTPIQLGFGFTLNGVGGVVGINRGIDTDALASLVRAGQSEDLLFPKNVVADAPTIIRDLSSVFPATQGRYVFGPLGKLGWGTPTLITGEVGIILEVPGPVVVILGEVKCVLPKPDAALVKFNLSIDGELDFPNKRFAMDAALHDSVINGFPVSGQMAMRVTWGDQPNFVFSIGGFHPAYTPPSNFPKLQPLALDLGKQGAATITVTGFFAVTSNTVQVGGQARLHAGGGGISLDASVSVKALFVFSPFSFEADIDASVKISFHGYGPSVHLSGMLKGPSPWHVKGRVCVSILWWDACFGFDVTFGNNQPESQPELDPWEPTDSAILGLKAALSDPGNWSGAALPGAVSSVTRAQGTDTLLDPVGGLTVRQKVAPVETAQPLTKFGVAKVSNPVSFSNVQATLGDSSGVSLTAVSPINENFAPAQFFDMGDAKKLSSPGFEQYQAGYLFATAANPKNVQAGSNAAKTLSIQTFVIGSDGSETLVEPPYTPSNAHVTGTNQRSAVAKLGLTLAGTRRFINRTLTQAFIEKVLTYVIASNSTLKAVSAAPAASVRSAALIALDTFRAQNVEQASGVQVAATHELAA
jgi:hypothetical protein